MKTIKIIFILFTLLLPLQLAAATYDTAINAYERNHFSQAFREFRQLARENDPYAQYMLGQMFMRGEGTKKDLSKAYKWLEIAEKNNMIQAKKLKNRVAKKMSYHQKKKAKHLISQWKIKNNSFHQPEYNYDRNTVRKVQKRLKSLGYYPYTIDGTMGKNTRNAIKNYQRYKGLSINGIITPALLEHLQINIKIDQKTAVKENRHIKDKLKRIVKKAKQRNDAEPWVIRQLEELISSSYSNSRTNNPVIIEDFRNYHNLSQLDWQINSGHLQMDQQFGILARPENDWYYSSNNTDNLGTVLLDTLIKHAAGQNNQSRLVKLQKDKNFGNAFSLNVETSLFQNTEGFIIACNNDKHNYSGYRLVVKPGYHEDEIKLLKIGRTTTEELYHLKRQLNLAGKNEHTFSWNRTPQGQMEILHNNQHLFTVTDTSNMEPFQQLSLAHIGQQVGIKGVQLHESGQHAIYL